MPCSWPRSSCTPCMSCGMPGGGPCSRCSLWSDACLHFLDAIRHSVEGAGAHTAADSTEADSKERAHCTCSRLAEGRGQRCRCAGANFRLTPAHSHLLVQLVCGDCSCGGVAIGLHVHEGRGQVGLRPEHVGSGCSAVLLSLARLWRVCCCRLAALEQPGEHVWRLQSGQVSVQHTAHTGTSAQVLKAAQGSWKCSHAALQTCAASARAWSAAEDKPCERLFNPGTRSIHLTVRTDMRWQGAEACCATSLGPVKLAQILKLKACPCHGCH